MTKTNDRGRDCDHPHADLLDHYSFIIASNRGPVTLNLEGGELEYQRGGGGLVTALTALANQIEAAWFASAMSETDRQWGAGQVPLGDDSSIQVKFVDVDEAAYNRYYNVITNPLLWFLQHSMWDYVHAPTLTRETWEAWEKGYVTVNQQFADAIAQQIKRNARPSIVMLQDYHLYLAPAMIHKRIRSRKKYLLTHFVHIPFPGPDDWEVLPEPMRTAILEGLCQVDLLGFQTRNHALNFIRSCENFVPKARVNYRLGRVILRHHATYARDFPISIDPNGLRVQAATEEVELYRQLLQEQTGDLRLILRIDRTEPSKNIVRGFQAYEEMLELHPEHCGQVQFLAIMVPSRLEVEEYQTYLDEIMAAAGRVNARYGTSEWEPVRVLVGESYPRAIAAMQLYDVLLVNPIADGMNLVAKEGPVVNQHDGVLVLSERAGASQQLGDHALLIAPCDVYATAQALHQALTMPGEERRQRAASLRQAVEEADIERWFCWQLDEVERLIQLRRDPSGKAAASDEKGSRW
ncbi:MAG: trehalose-6-phosphate synthase [Anaerolineaceae bacterium]|nr:trehalose-6-phosphate synthase [Anaerolineaceae bacterium]